MLGLGNGAASNEVDSVRLGCGRQPSLAAVTIGPFEHGYLLVFNILPVFSLDGGRVLQALLWFIMGRVRSLMVATTVGH
jgi:Zn-dependent protease